MAPTGHNANGQIKSVVERIERLLEEKKSISDDIRDIYAEAKGNGLNPKIIRAVIRERAQDVNERERYEAELDSYRHALGMLSGTIFEDAARANAEASA